MEIEKPTRKSKLEAFQDSIALVSPLKPKVGESWQEYVKRMLDEAETILTRAVRDFPPGEVKAFIRERVLNKVLSNQINQIPETQARVHLRARFENLSDQCK